MEVQGAGKEKGGCEGQSPGVRCCQDNSRQQCLLRRTKQNYLREQKSANTCLGGSSWGIEEEEKEKKEGGMVQCTKTLASTEMKQASVCESVRESEKNVRMCVWKLVQIRLLRACL